MTAATTTKIYIVIFFLIMIGDGSAQFSVREDTVLISYDQSALHI